MSYRVGVKPGKAASALGMVVGGLFVILGLVMMVPIFGAFGLVWTAVAAAMAVYYAYNLFSKQGVSTYEVNVDTPGDAYAPEARLRELARLKADGLISDQEYDQKRAEIMRRL